MELHVVSFDLEMRIETDIDVKTVRVFSSFTFLTGAGTDATCAVLYVEKETTFAKGRSLKTKSIVTIKEVSCF